MAIKDVTKKKTHKIKETREVVETKIINIVYQIIITYQHTLIVLK